MGIVAAYIVANHMVMVAMGTVAISIFIIIGGSLLGRNFRQPNAKLSGIGSVAS